MDYEDNAQDVVWQNAQEWLNNNFPKVRIQRRKGKQSIRNQRNQVRSLRIHQGCETVVVPSQTDQYYNTFLEGELDLSDFVNLESLYISGVGIRSDDSLRSDDSVYSIFDDEPVNYDNYGTEGGLNLNDGTLYFRGTTKYRTERELNPDDGAVIGEQQRQRITRIKIEKCLNLSCLEIVYTNLEDLNLKNNTALLYLDCSYNQLTNLNLENNPKYENCIVSIINSPV